MRTKHPESVNWVWLISVVALIISGGTASLMMLSQGHAAFNTTSQGPLVWGLAVVTYDYFVAFSIGMAFVAGTALVFNIEGLYESMKRVVWIAISALVGGILTLGLELGHPFRATYAILLNLQIYSPLFWKPILVFLYIWVLLAAYLRVNRSGWSPGSMKPIGYALFITGGLLAAGSAAVFGLMSMRPVWYDPMLPVYGIFESMVIGIAGIVVAIAIGHGGLDQAPPATQQVLKGIGRQGMALFTALLLLSVVVRAWGGLWSTLDGLQIWRVVVTSPPFWIEIAALVAALVLLMRTARLMLIAALLVIIATFIGRYEFIIAGQMIPLFKGAWVPGLVHYVPSLTEWMIALLGLALNFAIYTFGERWLGLSSNPAMGSGGNQPPLASGQQQAEPTTPVAGPAIG